MSLLALRQVGEGFLHAAGLGATAEGFRLLGERLRGQFSSHRAAWAKALAKANRETWETLELALDPGWLGQLKRLPKSADHKDLHRDLKAWLETLNLPAGARREEFLSACAKELAEARRSELFSGGRSDSTHEVALAPERAEALLAGADPDDGRAALVTAGALETLAAAATAAGLKNLALLLHAPSGAGGPKAHILAATASALLERDVRGDDELWKSLGIASWQRLERGQVEVLVAVHELRDGLGRCSATSWTASLRATASRAGRSRPSTASRSRTSARPRC